VYLCSREYSLSIIGADMSEPVYGLEQRLSIITCASV
jgi:hypothetical protein